MCCSLGLQGCIWVIWPPLTVPFLMATCSHHSIKLLFFVPWAQRSALGTLPMSVLPESILSPPFDLCSNVILLVTVSSIILLKIYLLGLGPTLSTWPSLHGFYYPITCSLLICSVLNFPNSMSVLGGLRFLTVLLQNVCLDLRTKSTLHYRSYSINVLNDYVNKKQPELY